MSERSGAIAVEVPRSGLRSYSFLGLGYRHNEPVPDRRYGWPVGRGIPLPKGTVANVACLRLRDESGRPVPLQARPLASWDDGSVMFAHIAWQCDVSHDRPAAFTLELNAEGRGPVPETPVVVEQGEAQIVVENGPLHVVIGRTPGEPMLSLQVRGKPVFDGALGLWTRDGEDSEYVGCLGSPEDVRVIEAGPLVAVIELSGRHRNEDRACLDYRLRLRFDAGRPELRLAHTFINLGDEVEGVAVGEIGFRLPRIVSEEPLSRVVCQVMSGPNSFPRLVELPENVDIHIGPTGPRVADVACLREDTSDYPPYLMHNRDLTEPYVGLRTRDWSAVTFFQEGPENWPKRLRVQDGVIEYDLWPAGSDLPVLRQGMARTHHVTLAFLEPDVPAVDLHRHYYQCETPAGVVVPFEWYQRCEVFGMQNFMSWMPERYRRVEGNLLATIERSWASGMLGYGDDPNSGYDYTNVGLPAETVWINNEHDFTSQAVIQFWRSGRPGAWKSARVAAEHQVDVDFVRKSDDRWKAGGIPAHCHGHTTAAVYPSHTWTEGLLQYYATSGDERALEVAKSLGRNLCQYVEERPEVFQVESRMMGWALIALTALIELTRDQRCLRAAHAIRDDIQDVVNRTGTYDANGMNYGTGTVLTGLGNLHRITGDEAALRLMRTILDWHIEHGRNAVGIPWCDQLQPYDLNLTLPAYAYAWYATGERKYLEEGIELFRFTGPPAAAGANVRSAGKHYRTYMSFLKMAHEAGVLDEMEQRLE